MHGQTDDIAVIQRVLQGQQSAYAILVDKYQQYVFTLILRYINNNEIAEELAQDVFVKAYKYLADFKGESKFSTWLYTIVNTTCITYLRKKKQDIILLEEDEMIGLSDNSAKEQPVIAHDQKAKKLIITETLKHLSKTDAQILTLFYMAEQSVEEISTITGLTESNIKVKLFRARQKFKEILESKYGKELIE